MPALLNNGLYTRSTYTLADAQTRVLSDLGLDDNVVITSGDVTRWLNEAQRIVARETRAFQYTTQLSVTSGIAEYALPSDTAGRCLSMLEVRYSTTVLPYITTDELYGNIPYWTTRGASTPIYYYLRGMSAIGFYPAPNVTSGGLVVVTYIAIPPMVTEVNDQFYVVEGCEDALISYALYRASLKDAYGEGRDRIAIYKAEWKEAILNAIQTASQVAAYEVTHAGQTALWQGPYGPMDSFPRGTIATPI